jgi:spore maturation protein CgeB
MKILYLANKTLDRSGVHRIDIGYWNFYVPLVELGHQVYFYDTVKPINKNLNDVIESFKPDLIFCCITGNNSITPYENLDLISEITKKGNIKTFNWFCDDTWRFDDFSSKACWYFTACSTPERDYVEQYKNIGYNNVIVGNWHTNLDLYPNTFVKNKNVSFCGGLNNQRRDSLIFLKQNGLDVHYLYGCSYEDMLEFYSTSNIGINFSKNENGAIKKTQMKLRIFEIPASKTMLLTEHHEGIEEYFEVNKEIVTFKTIEEALEKIKYFNNNSNYLNEIANNGFMRVKKDHDSKVRLEKLLKEIGKI